MGLIGGFKGKLIGKVRKVRKDGGPVVCTKFHQFSEFDNFSDLPSSSNGAAGVVFEKVKINGDVKPKETVNPSLTVRPNIAIKEPQTSQAKKVTPQPRKVIENKESTQEKRKEAQKKNEEKIKQEEEKKKIEERNKLVVKETQGKKSAETKGKSKPAPTKKKEKRAPQPKQTVPSPKTEDKNKNELKAPTPKKEAPKPKERIKEKPKAPVTPIENEKPVVFMRNPIILPDDDEEGNFTINVVNHSNTNYDEASDEENIYGSGTRGNASPPTYSSQAANIFFGEDMAEDDIDGNDIVLGRPRNILMDEDNMSEASA